MSVSYNIFINKKISFLEIKSCLESILNSQLHRDENIEWEVYRTNILGLEISLLEAINFEDDDDNLEEIKLSEYNYYVSVDYLPHAFDEDYIDDWRKMTSLIIGNMISNNLNCKCVVIKNMQILIALFPH